MKSVIVLASLLISTSVFANDVDPNGFEQQHFTSTKSRAEVVADLKAAQAAGQLPVGELGVKFVDAASTKSRAEVAAETRQAPRRSYGEVATID